MRTLDECKAEIFRRSEEKIKQRRKTRNRVLAACIPLCLCLSVGTVGALSGAFAAKGENMAAAPESAGWNDHQNVHLEDGEYQADCSLTVSGTGNQNSAESAQPEDFSSSANVIQEEKLITEELGEDYEILKDILLNLDYSPHRVCRCLPQYKLKTDFGEFGIHLSEGYARCDQGQAKLTAAQIQTLRKIIDKVK